MEIVTNITTTLNKHPGRRREEGGGGGGCGAQPGQEVRPSQLGSGGHAPSRGGERVLRAQGGQGNDPARNLERDPGGRRRRLLRQERRRGRLRARLPDGRRPGRGQGTLFSGVARCSLGNFF